MRGSVKFFEKGTLIAERDNSSVQFSSIRNDLDESKDQPNLYDIGTENSLLDGLRMLSANQMRD